MTKLILALLLSTLSISTYGVTLVSFKDGLASDPIWADSRGNKFDDFGAPYSAKCSNGECPSLVVYHNVTFNKPNLEYGALKVALGADVCIEESTTTLYRTYRFNGDVTNNGHLLRCKREDDTTFSPLNSGKIKATLLVDGNFTNNGPSADAVTALVKVAPDEGGFIEDNVGTVNGVFIDSLLYKEKGFPYIIHYKAYEGSVPETLSANTHVDIKRFTGKSYVSHLNQPSFNIVYAEELHAEGKEVQLSPLFDDSNVYAKELTINGTPLKNVRITPRSDIVSVNVKGAVTIKGDAYSFLSISANSDVTLAPSRFNAYTKSMDGKITAKVTNWGHITLDGSNLLGSIENHGTIHREFLRNIDRSPVFIAGNDITLINTNPKQHFFVGCPKDFWLTEAHYSNVNGLEVRGNCNFDMDNAVITRMSTIYSGGPRPFYKSTGAITLEGAGAVVTVLEADKVFLSGRNHRATRSAKIVAKGLDVYIKDQSSLPIRTIEARNLFVENSTAGFISSSIFTGDIVIGPNSALLGNNNRWSTVKAARVINNGLLGNTSKINATIIGDGAKLNGLTWDNYYGGIPLHIPPQLDASTAGLAFDAVTQHQTGFMKAAAGLTNLDTLKKMKGAVTNSCFEDIQGSPLINKSRTRLTDPNSIGHRKGEAIGKTAKPKYLPEATIRMGHNQNFARAFGEIIAVPIAAMIFERMGVPNPGRCASEFNDAITGLGDTIADDAPGFLSMITLARGGVREYDPKSIEDVEDRDAKLIFKIATEELEIDWESASGRDADDVFNENKNAIKEIVLGVGDYVREKKLLESATLSSIEIFGVNAIPLAADILQTDGAKSFRSLPDCMSDMMKSLDPMDFSNECNGEYLDLLNHKHKETLAFMDNLLPSCDEMPHQSLAEGWGDQAAQCIADAFTSASPKANQMIDIASDLVLSEVLIESKKAADGTAMILLNAAHNFSDQMLAADKKFISDKRKAYLMVVDFYTKAREFGASKRLEYYATLNTLDKSSPTYASDRELILSQANEVYNAHKLPLIEASDVYQKHGYAGDDIYSEAVHGFTTAVINLTESQQLASSELKDSLQRAITSLEEFPISAYKIKDAIDDIRDSVEKYESGFLTLENKVTEYDFELMSEREWLALPSKLNSDTVTTLNEATEDEFKNYMAWKWLL
ncbi:hypothetical protein BM525_20560 (plasmid) [Alteromonas mediterranea]|uniref:hypothetical protein n=1 Tax=Alteromonas mediterranea TaxID=314275 RepID=UPI0009041F26|nr:hypothetical protein [Alteromonas mediterranea]APE00120.1 hypothetical protein BM525_20560 [Alteromonas mediterranea]